MKIRDVFGGAGLFALSVTASALSLGQSQGQVTLGSPLDLVFQLKPDAGLDAAASCVEAAVHLGERRLDGARVHVTPLPAGPGQMSAVRLTSSTAVDEPVVRVKLSAGCQATISRSYTFLAELPESVARSAAPAAIGQGSALPVVTAVPEQGRGTASMLEPARQTASAARTGPAAVAAPKPSKAPATAPSPFVESRPRAAPLDGRAAPTAAAAAAAGLAVAAPIAPTLPVEAVSSAAGTAVAGAAGTAEVAGQTAAPTSSPAADARLLALETEIQALKSREAGLNTSLTQMRMQRDAMQSSPEGSIWTLPLLAALAIALAVLAWLLLRLRSLKQTPPAVDESAHEGGGRGREPTLPGPVAGAVAAAVSAPPWIAEPLRPSARTAEVGHSAVDAAVPLAALARDVVKPEELFDVRQQAEFFTSVGEYEQAIAVMRTHIEEHQDSSPLAYLELMGLYYQLSRKAEFDALRTQFSQYFAASVPEMGQFAQRGRSLVHYPELLATIEALWPTEEVGALLEGYLFRQPGQDSLLFDLEAFDDLLLLQAIARTTPAQTRGQVEVRVRTTPTVDDDEASGARSAAVVGGAGAGLTPGDEPWATLERAYAPVPSLPPALDPPPLSLDIPSRFDVPEGLFARSEPLPRGTGGAQVPGAAPLLDIDLSDVGRWAPMDLPTVEPLAFDAHEFPKRSIVGSAVDTGATDPKGTLSDDLELAPWDLGAADSLFSAMSSARTERVTAQETDPADPPKPGTDPLAGR